MKKGVFLSLLVTIFGISSDIQWGHGTMELKGGFLGLTNSISGDVDTYTLIENHKNLLGTNFFYGYNFTYFDSKKMKQLQKEYNVKSLAINSYIKSNTENKTIKIPEMEYRLQGIDAAMTLGYDLLHNSDSNYLGVGLYGGLSIPSIKSNKSNSSSSKLSDIASLYEASKTEISTYKVGIGLYAQTSLTKFLSLYSNAIYAYQTGNVKNAYAKSDFDTNGKYFEVGAGLKFNAINADLGLFSPKLYGTAGWRYRKWEVDDVSLNVSGAPIKAPKSDMMFSSNVFTLGFGYSF